MKTTIDIPDKVMEEAATYAHARTKRGIILAALNEFNHRHRVAEAMKIFGTFESMPSNDEIEALETGERVI